MYVVDDVIERTLLEKLYYSNEIHSLLTLVTYLLVYPFYNHLLLLNKGIIASIISFAEFRLLIKHLCVVLVHFCCVVE